MNRMAIALVAACSTLLLFSRAPAQDVHTPKVSFTLAVIHASGTTGKPDIDPQLKDIEDALLATGYKKFVRLNSKHYSYPPNTQIGAKLPEGYHLTMVTQQKTVMVRGKPKLISAVRAVITHKRNKKKIILDTTVILKRAKPALVAGPKLSGGVLILCFTGR